MLGDVIVPETRVLVADQVWGVFLAWATWRFNVRLDQSRWNIKPLLRSDKLVFLIVGFMIGKPGDFMTQFLIFYISYFNIVIDYIISHPLYIFFPIVIDYIIDFQRDPFHLWNNRIGKNRILYVTDFYILTSSSITSSIILYISPLIAIDYIISLQYDSLCFSKQ